MIDLCPRCRIQAPHRPGRDRCPRCGGPLQVVDGDIAAPPTHSRVGGPRSNGIYRDRHVRWVARRPPEAIPTPRPPRSDRPAGIPRYLYIPTWGLRDTPPQAATPVDRTAVLQAALIVALRWLAIALAAQTVAHLLRYVIVVVNRSTPIPGWLAGTSAVLVIFCGVVALAGYVYATVVFVRWLISLRHDAHRARGLLDPRRRWQVIVLGGVPLVNVIGAPLLIREVTDLRTDLDPARTRDRLTRVWVAWAVVNAVAIVAIITRIVAAGSGSIQTAANALVAVIVSSAVSAVFAWWLARRLEVVFAGAQHDPVPSHRWVVVGR